MEGGNTLKLSKQQKRDKKRALQVAAGLRPPKVSKRKRLLNEAAAAQQGARKQEAKARDEDNSLPPRVPSSWIANLPKDRFLQENDGALFSDVLSRSYDQFAAELNSGDSKQFHIDFQRALKDIDGYYDYDFVQPLGINTPLATTKVKRCLVGVPGTTYKYLGLRMFALPFCDDDEPFRLLKVCNNKMKEKTRKLLQSRGTQGGADYDILLINKCFSSSSPEQVKLKPEPIFKEDLASVSWHADSMLQPFSSIGVYNYVDEASKGHGGEDWRIGLRVTENIEGPSKKQRGFKSSNATTSEEEAEIAPPLAVKVPSESIYYLLGSFNHHHEHCVLAGDAQERYSSTHRCARQGHNYDTIKEKAKLFLGKKRKLGDKKYVAHLISLTSEVEFEWLRQWYVQGKSHQEKRVWWAKPIETLLQFWGSLQELISKSVTFAEEGKNGANDTILTLISGLSEIAKLRDGWNKREGDPIFDRVDSDHRPLPFPADPADYTEAVSRLQALIDTT